MTLRQQAVHRTTALRLWLLDELLRVKPLPFDEIKNDNQQGIYVIYDRDVPIYVGMTNRTGKIRLRELTSDYRSHTFNAKQMRRFIRESTGEPVPNLGKKTLDKLRIGQNDLANIQQQVNQYIRKTLRIAFLPVPAEHLKGREHFAIARFISEVQRLNPLKRNHVTQGRPARRFLVGCFSFFAIMGIMARLA
jgi:hypothetical protein